MDQQGHAWTERAAVELARPALCMHLPLYHIERPADILAVCTLDVSDMHTEQWGHCQDVKGPIKMM